MAELLPQIAHWTIFALGVKALLIGSDVRLVPRLRRKSTEGGDDAVRA